MPQQAQAGVAGSQRESQPKDLKKRKITATSNVAGRTFFMEAALPGSTLRMTPTMKTM